MKNLTIVVVFLLAMGFSVPIQAMARNDRSSSDQQSQSGGSSVDQQSQSGMRSSSGQDQASDPNAPAEPIVRGTVVELDPQTETITVTDFVSGDDKTFVVARQADLQDIKAGDTVNVTPQQGNPNKAQKVEKDRS